MKRTCRCWASALMRLSMKYLEFPFTTNQTLETCTSHRLTMKSFWKWLKNRTLWLKSFHSWQVTCSYCLIRLFRTHQVMDTTKNALTKAKMTKSLCALSEMFRKCITVVKEPRQELKSASSREAASVVCFICSSLWRKLLTMNADSGLLKNTLSHGVSSMNFVLKSSV